jgi:hypothetical protein
VKARARTRSIQNRIATWMPAGIWGSVVNRPRDLTRGLTASGSRVIAWLTKSEPNGVSHRVGRQMNFGTNLSREGESPLGKCPKSNCDVDAHANLGTCRESAARPHPRPYGLRLTLVRQKKPLAFLRVAFQFHLNVVSRQQKPRPTGFHLPTTPSQCPNRHPMQRDVA